MVEIRVFQFGSAEYRRSVELRHRILRAPLGLQFTEVELAQDLRDHHVGAFLNDDLVGCLILTARSSEIVKMRQVAVDSHVQGQGIGRALVSFSEAFARAGGFVEIEMHARAEVVPFYLALGYETVGEPLVEVTIEHRKMRKRI